MQLEAHLYQPELLKKAATRLGYGEGVVELGSTNPNIVVLSADLTESTRSIVFKEKFSQRFFEVGVAEQNLMGVAAGLALSGKVPFAASYAVFSPGRNWDQFRVSVCYSKANVKVVGGHTGLGVGPDGATHQALEDIAITRCLPNLTVVVPCDAVQAKKATLAIGKMKGPAYLRLTRDNSPIFTTEHTPFELGKAQVFRNGTDVTVIGTGPMVYVALLAADVLEKEKISVEVINVHTIKPIDSQTLFTSGQKTGAIVTIEDHQVHGGMGSAVAEVFAQQLPLPIEIMGVQDSFGESGTPEELYKKHHLTVYDVVKRVKKILLRK